MPPPRFRIGIAGSRHARYHAGMRDKTVLITGANSGIGRAIATELARRGARIVMSSRSEKRGRKAQKEIVRRSGNDRVELLIADLSTRDGIRGLSDAFQAGNERLDVLINNAAILTNSRRTTPEGYEMQFFVNHVAYFMLTNLLIDTIRATPSARIVNIVSTAHSNGTIDFDDLQFEQNYKGWSAYANSKLANIVFTYELARRLEGTGVTANCVHPGVIHTNLLRNYSTVLNVLFHALRFFFKTPKQGAVTAVHVASSPDVDGVTGKYFRDCAPMGTSEESNDRDVQRRLWDVSEEITGCHGMIPAR